MINFSPVEKSPDISKAQTQSKWQTKRTRHSLCDDDGLVDARPILALPERGPEVSLDRIRGRTGEVRVADVQVRLEDAFVVRDHVLGHLVHQPPGHANAGLNVLLKTLARFQAGIVVKSSPQLQRHFLLRFGEIEALGRSPHVFAQRGLDFIAGGARRVPVEVHACWFSSGPDPCDMRGWWKLKQLPDLVADLGQSAGGGAEGELK